MHQVLVPLAAMKAIAIVTALLPCLAPVVAVFSPPQVFRNVNLVHIISLERNYAREIINVQIENINKAPQDEYYIPFTSDRVARLGGFEVKDRKNQEAGQFALDVLEPNSDSHSDSNIQFYRIKLPSPLAPGAQQTLGISFYVLKAYSPLPLTINQDEKQYLVHDFNAYAPSAYKTTKQKTEVKTTGPIQEYTILDGDNNPKGSGTKLTYGPFSEVAAGMVQPAKVRFEFTKPVLHVAKLHRDVEVSHWGGNVAFEERYTLHHRGANLSSQFNRVKWVQSNFYNPTTYALKELRFPLRLGSVDAYYTDAIGNVSTSNFRTNKREAVLETKPRYPLFGGWAYPFTIGWNSDAKNFLRKTTGAGYVLNVPFLEGPKQVEGVEYKSVQIRIVLPEGAT